MKPKVLGLQVFASVSPMGGFPRLASARQNPHLPAPLSYKGLTQASIGFRFILFPPRLFWR